MRYARAFTLLLLVFAGCIPQEQISTSDQSARPTKTPTLTLPPSTPTGSPTPPKHTVEPATKAVLLNLSEATTSRTEANIRVGDTAIVEVFAKPVIHQITRRPDGSVESASSIFWDDHNVDEMRICAAPEHPCAPEGEWRPFSESTSYPLEVAWIGPKEFWVTAQFRDSSGIAIPGVAVSFDEPTPMIQKAYTIVGVVDLSVPIEQLPCPAQTAMATTRSAFPVQGSLEIEGGACCAGGTAGDQIEVDVAFEATSPYADVAEMRTLTGGRCFSEAEMQAAKWQPFAQQRQFPVQVIINWVGFYVTVQYRDGQGHLSGAYCDDISVEGHPAPTTP